MTEPEAVKMLTEIGKVNEDIEMAQHREWVRGEHAEQTQRAQDEAAFARALGERERGEVCGLDEIEYDEYDRLLGYAREKLSKRDIHSMYEVVDDLAAAQERERVANERAAALEVALRECKRLAGSSADLATCLDRPWDLAVSHVAAAALLSHAGALAAHDAEKDRQIAALRARAEGAAEALESLALEAVPLAPEKGGCYAEPVISAAYLRLRAAKLREGDA